MDLDFASLAGTLEVRRMEGKSARKIAGAFPYGKRAVLSDGGRAGRPRKEQFAPGAFRYRVDDDDAEIHLLSGHDYGKPLARRGNGTLKLTDGPDALRFEAVVTDEVAETSHGRDALALLAAGLATGISPGFRLPPERAVPRKEAETFEDEELRPEEGMHAAIIRTVNHALLYELSLVTRPAYPEAEAEERMAGAFKTPRPSALARWRP